MQLVIGHISQARRACPMLPLPACRLQDQLIIFMAMAEGESKVTCTEPTLHTRTAMVIAEQLTAANFAVQKPSGPNQCWQIHCQGAGLPAGKHG